MGLWEERKLGFMCFVGVSYVHSYRQGLTLRSSDYGFILSIIGRHLIWVLGSCLCVGAKPSSLAGEVFVPELDH